MNIVYVIQNVSGKNILPAKDFGKLHVILTGHETREDATITLQRTLTNFRDGDFLLLIGNPVYIGIACHIVLTVNHGKMKTLVWDKQHYIYNEELICL